MGDGSSVIMTPVFLVEFLDLHSLKCMVPEVGSSEEYQQRVGCCLRSSSSALHSAILPDSPSEKKVVTGNRLFKLIKQHIHGCFFQGSAEMLRGFPACVCMHGKLRNPRKCCSYYLSGRRGGTGRNGPASQNV